MVFSGPGVSHVGDGNVHALVSLVDLLPTFLVRAILVRALLPPGGRVRYRRWSRPLFC
jgi:arylsulfatase A-like enzyme